MILLSSIINEFKDRFLDRYKNSVKPHKGFEGHGIGKNTARTCWCNVRITTAENRSIFHIPVATGTVPIASHENRQWIENQLSKRLPTQYYLITFTLPRQLRDLAWKNQKTIYSLMFAC